MVLRPMRAGGSGSTASLWTCFRGPFFAVVLSVWVMATVGQKEVPPFAPPAAPSRQPKDNREAAERQPTKRPTTRRSRGRSRLPEARLELGRSPTAL